MTPISIVLPVRNGGAFLHQTLDSIFRQTYPHFTLLVLENTSTDNTLEIVSAFPDDRIRIMRADRPLTIEQNWGRIRDLPLETWMTILSHDDLWHPDFLSKLITLTEIAPDASLYTAQFDLIDADGAHLRPARLIPARENGDAFLERRHHWHADSFGTGYLMRSADYRAVGGIPALAGLFYADDVLWSKLANLSGKVSVTDRLFSYRYYRASNARTIDLEGLVSASIDYLDYLHTRPYFRDAGRSAAAVRYVERHISRNYQRFLVTLIGSGDRADLTAYAALRTALLERAARDGRFAVYNSTLRLIEAVRAIPTRAGRRLVLNGLETVAKAVRRVTD
jgi:glycosyltransferase involved in cell wall biosynthesis